MPRYPAESFRPPLDCSSRWTVPEPRGCPLNYTEQKGCRGSRSNRHRLTPRLTRAAASLMQRLGFREGTCGKHRFPVHTDAFQPSSAADKLRRKRSFPRAALSRPATHSQHSLSGHYLSASVHPVPHARAPTGWPSPADRRDGRGWPRAVTRVTVPPSAVWYVRRESGTCRLAVGRRARWPREERRTQHCCRPQTGTEAELRTWHHARDEAPQPRTTPDK